jgi:hypothetical protein
MRELLARVGGVLTPRPKARFSVKAASTAVRDLVASHEDAVWYAHLAAALLRWNGGVLHPALEAQLDAWDSVTLPKRPSVRTMVELHAEGARFQFASFDVDRLVYGASVSGGGVVVDQGREREVDGEVSGVFVLGTMGFLVRSGKRWRAVWGKAKSAPYDRVERMLVHGETPVYVVRAGAKRRVIYGAQEHPAYERVRLPVWEGAMAEIAPEFFVEAIEGHAPFVYAAKSAKGWRVVRDDAEGAATYDDLDDLHGVGGEVMFRARLKKVWYFVKGTEQSPGYSSIPKVSYAAGRPIYRARTGRQWTVVDGPRLRRWYDAISPGEVRAGEPFYAGRQGEDWFVMHGERRWGPYVAVTLLPPPMHEHADSEACDDAANDPVAFVATLGTERQEVVHDGRPVASFERVVATLPLRDGVVCAGVRRGRVAVIDHDGAILATAEKLVRMPDTIGFDEVYLDRLGGRTLFMTATEKSMRLYAGRWASAPAKAIVPLGVHKGGVPVYATREGARWTLHAGAKTHTLSRKPLGAEGDSPGGDEARASVTVFLSDGREVTLDV